MQVARVPAQAYPAEPEPRLEPDAESVQAQVLAVEEALRAARPEQPENRSSLHSGRD